jgi:glycosyltransferase involved in cell wall biosynthesis
VKFSVLLPTRNRLELLSYAIESVRRQDYADWEVVVSDNCSEQDVAGYVTRLADPRVRYFRTDRFVPVTDNWNNALDKSTGDYFIMLGDDDALLPGCLRRVSSLIDSHRFPDAIYIQAVQYAYPGVMPDDPSAFTQFGHVAFLERKTAAFFLERETARAMVRNALDLRMSFGFNMQHFLVSRALLEALRDRGPFFQSPYPDYYAANAILLRSPRLLVEPEPMVIIGISPKSYGFYHFNRRESEGVAFLSNVAEPDIIRRLEGVLVPGSNMNTSWLCAMETLKRNFGAELPGDVNYRRYRLLQFIHLARSKSANAWLSLLRHARLWELLVYGAAATALALTVLLPPTWRRRLWRHIKGRLSPYPSFDAHKRRVPYATILELFEHEAKAHG